MPSSGPAPACSPRAIAHPPRRLGYPAARPIAWALLSLLALGLTGWASRALAQTPAVIADIRIEGTTAVEHSQLVSRLASTIGAPLDSAKITQDVSTIFELGLFQDVRAQVEELPGKGYVLIFSVEEKPRITSLQVLGATLLPAKKVSETVTLRAGATFSRKALRAAIEALRREYRSRGYLKVKITSKAERLGAQAYAVTILVEETPRVYITDIRAHHNTVRTELYLQRLMSSGEVDCFNWMNDSGVFDEDKINQDLGAITSDYLSNGYIRLYIHKPEVRIVHNAEFSRVRVDLTLDEGAQYFTGKVDIDGDILGNKDELLEVLNLKSGEVYNPYRQNRDVFALSEIYQEQGYAFAQVQPVSQINDNTHIVDVTYHISRGDKAYIGRIEFQGNRETRDFVVRREFEVRENELYNGRKLRESQENLSALGYFQPGIALERVPGVVDNVLDINTVLEESQTGTLQAQLGYSEQSGITVAASVSKGNLGGRGQTLRFSAQASQTGTTRNFTLDFIEPHLLDTNVSSDSTLNFNLTDDLSELNRGVIEETYVSQGFGFPVYRRWTAALSYAITDRNFSDAINSPVRLRAVTPSLRYNSVNHPIFPTDGTSLTFSVAQVGGSLLGGTSEYRSYRLLYRNFVSLNEDSTLILSGRVRLGWLETVGDSRVPPEDRFRLGGLATVHGYDFQEIGGVFGRRQQNLNAQTRVLLDAMGNPVLDSDGNPSVITVDKRTLGLSQAQLDQLAGGGVMERLFNLELLFPLTGPSLRGVVFYDAGNVNSEKIQYKLLGEKEPDFFDLLQSVGFGVRFITPVGVLRFEYGAKLAKEKGESPDKFDFTISTLF
ncbi:MAG: outer membrane protein assembly factor BamA [Candidatus Lambdaproteobacteria bacterium]|nr:outer membrane protein assembly factor BamA [Candidatus Lambdaproteobacteria bacterium]